MDLHPAPLPGGRRLGSGVGFKATCSYVRYIFKHVLICSEGVSLLGVHTNCNLQGVYTYACACAFISSSSFLAQQAAPFCLAYLRSSQKEGVPAQLSYSMRLGCGWAGSGKSHSFATPLHPCCHHRRDPFKELKACQKT